MASVQLYAKMPGAAVYTLLDLHESEPIKLTLSVQDIQDPLAATSSFSRTFRVPHTGVNGPFFKGVFNVNSTDFDASKKADAYILDNGQFFTNGNIRLISIYSSDYDGKVEYEITFFGETSDFGSKIGGGFLNELDFTQYNHDKTWTNIVQSWTNGLFSGDVVYGLIEWGYDYNANNQPIEPTLSNGFSNSFTLSSKALWLEQWKPQFRAKSIWDQVFKESGYTYDSQFLNSQLFKSLYVISENSSQATLNINNTFEAENFQSDTNVVGVTPRYINCNNEVFDPGQNYNPSTSTYTAPVAGSYTFEYESDIYIGYGFFSNLDAIVRIAVLDAITGNTLSQSPPTSVSEGYTTYSTTITVYLTAGQSIRFSLNSFCTGGDCYTGSTQIQLFSQYLRCITAPAILSINSIMPSNVRKIDFMRSIINRFRLVFVPSRDNEMHFTIVPWKDWVLQGNSRDWSNKLDTSKDLKITPLFYGQERFQIYKDQEDGDYLNYNYQLTYKQTYGQLNLDSTNELIKGTKTTQDQFAPTPIAPIGFKEGDINGSRFLIPHISKDTGSSDDTTGTTVITGKREPIQPKLRLVFYNGLVTSPLTWYAHVLPQGSTSLPPVALTQYPFMSQYSTWPITPTTIDLNWENEPPFWDVSDSYLSNGNTANSIFNVYWKTWYDTTFDPYSRIVEANVVLDYDDVLDLKFNDYVFIKDAWYFVNKITDFIIGQKTNCRVELVKVGNIGLTLPVVFPQYTEVTLCKGSTVCGAYCCIANQGSVDGVYWINGSTLATSNTIFLDQTGSNAVPAGYYSDGSVVAVVNNSGIIQAFGNTASCNCTQTGTSFTAKTSSVLCTVCCGGGSTVTVYGLDETFLANGYLYLNASLTTPAPTGWYLVTGSLPVFVGENGQITQVGNCDSCQCLTYYPHVVCADTSSCAACCCYNPTQTVFSTATTFSNSTQLFLDNSGTTPAPSGSYKKGNDVANVVGSSGDIVSFSTCTTCTPCIEGDVEVYVEIFVERAGYNSNALLQKSFDNINWIDVGTLNIIPSGGGNATASNSYFLNPLIYTRVIFTSNVDGGTMNSEHLVNTTSIEEVSNSTPGSRTLTSDILVDGNIYKFLCRVEGGNIAPLGPVNKVYVGGNYGLYQDAGWPVSGTINDLLSLDTTATIDTDFDTSFGFTAAGANVFDLQEAAGILVLGLFGEYKFAPCTFGATLLNMDGTLNTGWNVQKGTFGVATPVCETPGCGINEYFGAYANTADIKDGYAYIGGVFNAWSEAAYDQYTVILPLHYTYIAKVELATGLVDTSFSVLLKGQNTDIGYLPTINRIKIFDNKIYVAGSFQIEQDGLTWTSMVRLNMDGTIDTSWSNKGVDFTYAFGVTPPIVTDFEFYGSYVYVCGNFTTWTTSTGTFVSNRFIRLNLINGSPDITFDTDGGFNFNCIALAVDPTGIYCGGSFTEYGGIDIPNRLVKINHDATVNATFVSPGVTAVVSDIKISADNTELYVGGNFTSYNGVTSKGLVKVDPTTGARDSVFAVGEGFENNTDVNVILLGYGPATPTTYEFGLCYGAESPCVAYCCNNGSASVWGNAQSLTTSTILYSNSTGTTFASPGYYSDGTSIAQVSENGVIIAFVNPAGCKCATTVKQFHVVYDADTLCDACCGIPNTNVWSNATTWSTTSILYSDSGATTFASPGYYNFAGIVLTIGSNGVVLEANICECSCPSEDCYEWIISNNSGEAQASYAYTDCSGTPRFGTLNPLTATITTCTTYSSLSVSGDVSIQQGDICGSLPVNQYCYDGFWELNDPLHPDGGTVTYLDEYGDSNTITGIWLGYPVTFSASSIVSAQGAAPCPDIEVLNVFGYMEPCIGGTIDDHMGAQIYLNSPVSVDTTFFVDVQYVLPGNTCGSFTYTNSFQLEVPAGEQGSFFNACNNGYYLSGGAVICSACVNSYAGNNIDPIDLGEASC